MQVPLDLVGVNEDNANDLLVMLQSSLENGLCLLTSDADTEAGSYGGNECPIKVEILYFPGMVPPLQCCELCGIDCSVKHEEGECIAPPQNAARRLSQVPGDVADAAADSYGVDVVHFAATTPLGSTLTGVRLRRTIEENQDALSQVSFCVLRKHTLA